MRLLLAALMFVLMAAATIVANLPSSIPEQIRNADRRGGHRMVDLSRIAAWPSFDRAGIRWPDPAAIERAINGEWAEAHAARGRL
jgi:hypothetical protein